MEKSNPYQPGSCWYGIRVPISKQNGPGKPQVFPCGVGANLYDVVRQHGDKSIVLKVWLCDNHALSMREQGFVIKKTVDIKVP